MSHSPCLLRNRHSKSQRRRNKGGESLTRPPPISLILLWFVSFEEEEGALRMLTPFPHSPSLRCGGGQGNPGQGGRSVCMARARKRKIRFLGREKRVPSFSGRRKGGLEKILSKYSPHPQVGERGSGMNHCPTKTGGEKLFCPPTSSLYWVRGRGHRAPWSFKFKTRVEERASAKKSWKTAVRRHVRL